MSIDTQPSTDIHRARLLDDASLIRLILRYHAAHLADLASAVELARLVAHRHRAATSLPDGLAEELERTLVELREHQAREEAVLFPAILGGQGEMLRYPIAALGVEHDQAQDQLERLVLLTGDFTPPAGACVTWVRLYDLCRKFDAEFREHVQLEERVLFPRFR